MLQPSIEVSLTHSGLVVSLRAQVGCEGGSDESQSSRFGYEDEPIEPLRGDLCRDLVPAIGSEVLRAHQALLASLLQSEAHQAEIQARGAAEQALEGEGASVGLTD